MLSNRLNIRIPTPSFIPSEQNQNDAVAFVDPPTRHAQAGEIDALARETKDRNTRVRRSTSISQTEPANAPAATVSAAIETLNGDLPLEHGSLLTARIIATRRLLSEEALGREDEEMLDLANQVHKNARDNPADEAATELSKALYREECAIWSQQNGGEGLDMTWDAIIQAYEEAWSLALNPPLPPQFKTRLQLAADDIQERGLKAPPAYMPWIGEKPPPMPKEMHIRWHANDSEIIKKYYTQFSDYIDQHLDRLCEAKALASAQAAGLPRLALEQRPEQAWMVRVHSLPKFDIVNIQRFTTFAEGLVLRLPGEKFAVLSPDGSFKYLDKLAATPDLNGLCQKETLRQLFGDHAANPRSHCLVTDETLPPTASLKDMIKQRVRETALATLESWKQDLYDPSGLEIVLRAIVPFYETAHKLINDSGYTLKFEDIAWDLFDLGLMIATIGASSGVIKSVRAGWGAAKAMQSASTAARAATGLHTALMGFKTGTFLRITGRELTDFIIPVFTTQQLARTTSKAALTLAREGLSLAMRQINMAAAKLIDANELLERIYINLHRSHHIPNPAAITRATIAQRASIQIPAQLFRGQSIASERNILSTSWKTIDDAIRDDYLAACIKHSSRTGGSKGEVLSLSMDQRVAARFARGREDGKVLMIDTTTQPENFRTIEHILQYDGPRLVQNGKISAATLAAAIKHTINQTESEVFCMLGSIPDALITIQSTKPKRAIWG